ncbi:MAG: glycosyl hydrolase family 28 protein, partial [Anaerolineaceae bacterium]|nr:glycosyl hydrolase family 28 protein [Anaerolineaceae bacterium]
PAGIFLTGSIVLKNGVELYIEDNATMLGSTNPVHYKEMNNWRALILADNAFDIAIKGNGTIDGQGRALALNVDSLHHIGELVDPRYNLRRMRPSEYYRPQLIYLMNCKKVEVSGLSLKNASCWVQTYEQCTDLEIDQIKVESRAYWNNDGFDIVDCRNVRVTNCDVNSADDGICLKSHSPDHISDQVYIANCTVRSSASAIKFGTASYGGFKNIVIENIKVFDTYRSAIAIESVDGGLIENIEVSNITAVNTWNAIFIRLGHRAGDRPGIVKNISIKDVSVQVPFGRPDIDYDMRGPAVESLHNPFPAPIAGIPGHYIENITLENIQITYPGRATKGMAYIPLSRLDQV